jgi:hypothetical protein
MKFEDYFLDTGDIVEHFKTGATGLITNIHTDYNGTRYEIKFLNPDRKEWVKKNEIRLVSPVG